jgi:hypothetical protein
MANTVSLLSYANTFGDWVVTTNALVGENNSLATNNFIKQTGTLYLNEPTLGLQVANNAIIAGALQVQGTGSSAYVQNNLRVDGTSYLTNSSLSLVTTGQANIGGPLLAQASGNALQVANNALIGGSLTINQNEFVGGTLTVTNDTTLNKRLSVANIALFSSNVNITKSVNVVEDVNALNFNATNKITGYDLQILGDSVFDGEMHVQGNFVIDGTTVYNTDTFTLNAASSVGTNSFLVVNRGTSGANASIRWNETNKNWDILDTTGGSYYKILTQDLISDSVSTANSLNLASSTAANTLNNSINDLSAALRANVITINSNISSNVSTLNNNITSNVSTLTSYINANVALNAGINSTQNTNINNNLIYAQAAFNKANTGGVFTGDVTVTGNFLVNGTTTTINTNTIQTNDSLIQLAANNPSDSVDIGFYGQYTSAGAKYTGLIRQAGTGTFHLLNGLTTNPTGNTVSFTATNRATLNANLTGGSVSGLSQVVAIADGGTNASSFTTGRITFFDGTRLSSLAPQTITTTNLTTNSVITAVTADSYGRITGFTTSAIAITSGQVSGLATSATTDTTNASNITSGTLSDARLPYSMNQGVSTGNDVRFRSLGVGTNPTGTNGEVVAIGNITAYYSDDRLKTRLGLIDNALEKLMTLDGFYYEANETAQALGYEAKKEVGVSAQQVQAIMPEVVAPAPIDNQYLTVRYEKLVPLLIESIKEQQNQINVLKAEIDSLKSNK